jgi:uncharacterized protein
MEVEVKVDLLIPIGIRIKGFVIAMNKALNNTFIIPVNNDFLVYSPLAGISALINRTGALELKEQLRLSTGNLENPESKLAELAHDILQSPVQEAVRRNGDLNPEFLGIVPTRSCNGACNYCDFGAEKASTEKMSYQLAANAIDWYAGLLKTQQRNMLDIHFFGGEPMVARDVIEVIVQRARLVAMKHNLVLFFEISTNGQYSGDDARFLGKYFNKVVLSLDGFEEMHSKHRPLKSNRSSFENAVETAKIISSSNTELCVRCCVSRLNVLRMEEITQWLCQDFRLSAINFEILCSTSQTDSAGLFPPDPVDFAIHFQKSREIANGFGVEVVYASDISGLPVMSSCPVGKDTAIISPDGRISSCYLMPERWQSVGLDLDYGLFTNNDGVQIEKNKVDAIRNMVENKPRCSKCFCQWTCAGGCHVGITHPGSGLEYNNFCRQTRLISAFTLLSNLELRKKTEELMQSPGAIQKLINQESDRIPIL